MEVPVQHHPIPILDDGYDQDDAVRVAVRALIDFGGVDLHRATAVKLLRSWVRAGSLTHAQREAVVRRFRGGAA